MKKTNQKLHTFYLVFLTVSSGMMMSMITSHAEASPFECSQFFSSTSDSFESLPGLELFDLPEDFKRTMKEHPISGLSETYRRGKNLTFALQFFKEGSLISDGFLGESIQAKFVSKILKELFPLALFDVNLKLNRIDYDGWNQRNPNQRLIVLKIKDPAEDGLIEGNKNQILMPLLKPANPGIAGVSHGFFRTHLGISNETTIASFYLKWISGKQNIENYESVPSVLNLIREMKKNHFSPDLVFFSAGGEPKSTLSNLDKYLLEREGYQVHLLSEFERINHKVGSHLFINDLKGKLPYLYNISDLAIVSGPINFFEPISSGVKTIIFNNDLILRNYNRQVFNEMIRLSKLTGGGFPVSGMSELSQQLPFILKTTNSIQSPYLYSTKELLNHLYEILKETLSENVVHRH